MQEEALDGLKAHRKGGMYNDIHQTLATLEILDEVEDDTPFEKAANELADKFESHIMKFKA